MAKEKDKENEYEIEAGRYASHYNKAYLKLDKMSENEMDFDGVLSALILTQESFSNRSRDARNMFFINSFVKSGIIAFDTGLPDVIKIWQYYCNLSKPSEENYAKEHIFKDFEQAKKFYIAFMNRVFKGGINVEECNFFDKIVLNTLIKAKMLIRYDSSLEDINITAKAFFQV